MHIRYLKSPNDRDLQVIYKRYINHCNKVLHNLKNDHDKSDLNYNRHVIKRTWNVIKRECNLNVLNKWPVPIELLKLKSTPQESVDFINNFFVNMGSKLSNDILQKLQLTENNLVHVMED